MRHAVFLCLLMGFVLILLNAGCNPNSQIEQAEEINADGTAIMKVSDNPPASNGVHFIDKDGQPSDHYLWLTGQGAKMLRKEIPVNYEIAKRE